MNEQEREVISDIFRRLESAANQPRDPEAERFIADKLRQQPYAPYAMAQTIFVQEQALGNLQAENEQLRAELEQARQQPQQGGFLSSIFGGASRPPQPAYREPPRQGSPWGHRGAQPMQQPYGAPQGGMQGGPWGSAMQPRGGGGFLQGALATAAGVAGGMMIANALTNAFSGGADHAAGGDKTALADPGAGDHGAGGDNAGITDSLYPEADQANYAPDDFSDFGGDGGDGGDWI